MGTRSTIFGTPKWKILAVFGYFGHTENGTYQILCPCAHPKDYVGSTQDFKVRWSNHKSDCRNGRWANCGLAEHFGQHHRDEMEVAIADLKVTLLDHLTGNYREERLLQLEKDWIIRLGTFGPTGLNTRNQLLSQQKELGSRPLI